MNKKDFKEFEAKLGRPPTAKEVQQAKPKFKTAYIRFTDPSYDYRTSVNGNLTNEEIVRYFKGQSFNLGNVDDNVQICIECSIES